MAMLEGVFSMIGIGLAPSSAPRGGLRELGGRIIAGAVADGSPPIVGDDVSVSASPRGTAFAEYLQV